MKMYGELAAWWPLLSAPEDYDEEAEIFFEAIEEHAGRPVGEVLELGCGGGNNASHLKGRVTMTLTDISEEMLNVSRALNPECEHVQGDMRTLRLGREFDAVLVHDAISYMTTEGDVSAVIRTAAAHLRPRGVALLVPDDTVESYEPQTDHGGHDGEGRALRYLSWSRPATGTTYEETFVIVTQDAGAPVRVVHDEHHFGLFPRATWMSLIADAGLDAVMIPYEHSTFRPDAKRVMFAGIKP